MAGKQERQRRLARERYERRLARQAQRQQAVRRTTAWAGGGVVVLIVVVVVVLVVLHLLGGKKASAQGLSPSPSRSLPTSTPSPTPTATPPATEPATHCDYVASGTAARPVGGLPPAAPDSKAAYQATIKTNRGNIVIDLLNSKATCTVNSFVFLASKNYFSNTHCHRLTTSGIFVLQCGDPTGTGTGGPGYEFYSENLTGAKYPMGTVAMANSGAPYTNGSQFFLVYKNTTLPPSYTPFGTIVSGLSVIQKVASAGTVNKSSDGQPKEAVIISSVVIKKT